jgi:hypothetical protein
MPRPVARLVASLALVLFAASALAARADLVTVKDLLAEPDKWHGRAVVVTGGVGKLEARTSKRGNPYYTFLLNDGMQSVTVFSYGTPEVRDGSRVQVEGTFLKIKRVGQYTFHNQVDARRISVL